MVASQENSWLVAHVKTGLAQATHMSFPRGGNQHLYLGRGTSWMEPKSPRWQPSPVQPPAKDTDCKTDDWAPWQVQLYPSEGTKFTSLRVPGQRALDPLTAFKLEHDPLLALLMLETSLRVVTCGRTTVSDSCLQGARPQKYPWLTLCQRGACRFPSPTRSAY